MTPAQNQPVGRLLTTSELAALVVRMATENPDWSYRRIQAALSNLGHTVSLGTIADILKKHGIGPAPDGAGRRHGRTLYLGVWTRRELQRFLLLFIIEWSNPTGKDRRCRGASQRAKDEPDSPKYQ